MEKCAICEKPIGTGTSRGWFVLQKGGNAHLECVDVAVTSAIAAREAEKPKMPTLGEEITDSLYRCGYIVTDGTVAAIIAMVREHDGTQEWKSRAEQAEATIAAVLSELST